MLDKKIADKIATCIGQYVSCYDLCLAIIGIKKEEVKWQRVKVLKPLDIILIKNNAGLPTHCVLYIGAGKVVNSSTTEPCFIDRMSSSNIRNKTIGYFRACKK